MSCRVLPSLVVGSPWHCFSLVEVALDLFKNLCQWDLGRLMSEHSNFLGLNGSVRISVRCVIFCIQSQQLHACRRYVPRHSATGNLLCLAWSEVIRGAALGMWHLSSLRGIHWFSTAINLLGSPCLNGLNTVDIDFDPQVPTLFRWYEMHAQLIDPFATAGHEPQTAHTVRRFPWSDDVLLWV